MDALRARIERNTLRSENGCLIWTGSMTGTGYGRIGFKRHQPAKLAHRLAWELECGSIPKGLFVCHRCDNPLCVNVDHLFLGTHLDNMADMRAKGRSQRGERNPAAKLTEEQVKAIRADARACRTIAKDYGVTAMSVWHIRAGSKWRAAT